MKQKSLCLLAALLMTTILAVTVSAADTYPVGDLDFNGSVSAADLTALARQVAKLDPLPEGYTAMGVPSWDCEHYASDWFTVKEPDCTQDGFRHTLCLICGKELERELLPATGHTEVVDEGVEPTCTATGLTDGAHCGVCGHVIVAKRIIAALGHTPGEWEVTRQPTATTPGSRHKVCTVCGEEVEAEEIAALGSQDLTYSYDATTMTATVTGLGSCKDWNIVIPSTVNGYTVTGIGDNAFYQRTSPRTIYIPDTVTSIGDYAFFGCSKLTSVTIPDSVTHIGDSAFGYCESLASIKIPDGVTSIGSSAFSYTAYYNNASNWEDGVLYNGRHLIEAETDITSCQIKEGTKTIADSAFYYCTRLTSIEIPDGVTSIGGRAFYNCTSLASIVIPDSLASIGYRVFYNCTSLTSITFEGTVEEWNAVVKSSQWDLSTGDYTVTCLDGTVAKDGTVTML